MALIYVVEDDEPIRRELVDILARAGFEVEACESFEHVSRDILAAAPDLVLLDLTLPVKDGPAYLPRGSPRIRGSHHRSHVAHDRDRRGHGHDARRGRLCFQALQRPCARGAHQCLAASHRGGRRAQYTCPQGTGARPRTLHGHQHANGHQHRAHQKRAAYPLAASEPRGQDRFAPAIMQDLWDSDAFVDDNTLTVNINRLRTTLEKIGIKGYLTTHRGQGYSV